MSRQYVLLDRTAAEEIHARLQPRWGNHPGSPPQCREAIIHLAEALDREADPLFIVDEPLFNTLLDAIEALPEAGPIPRPALDALRVAAAAFRPDRRPAPFDPDADLVASDAALERAMRQLVGTPLVPPMTVAFDSSQALRVDGYTLPALAEQARNWRETCRQLDTSFPKWAASNADDLLAAVRDTVVACSLLVKPGADLGTYFGPSAKVEGWDAVAKVLDEVAPNWQWGNAQGHVAAVKAIRDLAARGPEIAQQVSIDAFGWHEVRNELDSLAPHWTDAADDEVNAARKTIRVLAATLPSQFKPGDAVRFVGEKRDREGFPAVVTEVRFDAANKIRYELNFIGSMTAVVDSDHVQR